MKQYLYCKRVKQKFIYFYLSYFVNWTEVYSNSCQTSKVKLFSKIVKNLQPLTILGKSSILDIFQSSECASAVMLFSVTLLCLFLSLVLKMYDKLSLHLQMFNSCRNQLIWVAIQSCSFYIAWLLVNKRIKVGKILS